MPALQKQGTSFHKEWTMCLWIRTMTKMDKPIIVKRNLKSGTLVLPPEAVEHWEKLCYELHDWIKERFHSPIEGTMFLSYVLERFEEVYKVKLVERHTVEETKQ
jgi:hypothetical protein